MAKPPIDEKYFGHLSKEMQKYARANKRDVIWRIYLDTADESYIAARLCIQNGLDREFIWSAIHSLEKYLKCALLINGYSAKSIGHDVAKGYRKLQTFADDLLPKWLEQPDLVALPHWRRERPIEFFDRLMKNGGADVRYNLLGYVAHREDVLKLDEMVFQIRRLSVELDASPISAKPNLTNRAILKKQSSYSSSRSGSPLDRLRSPRKRTSPLAIAAFNLNQRFAPPEFEHGSLPSGTSASNAVLLRRLVRELEASSTDRQEVGAAVLHWFLKNNQIPGNIKKELESYLPSHLNQSEVPKTCLSKRFSNALRRLANWIDAGCQS